MRAATVTRVGQTPLPDTLNICEPAKMTRIFIKPPLLARLFAGLAALRFVAVLLTACITWIGRKVFFTAWTCFLQTFHDNPDPLGKS